MTDRSSQVDVLLPALNEEAAISRTITDFAIVFPDACFVVVNNGSDDDTRSLAIETLESLDVEYRLVDEPRRGKGFAVRAGLEVCRGDVVVMADADATYDATDARRMTDLLLADELDLVVGDRHSSGAYRRTQTSRLHRIGNRMMQSLVNRFYRCELSDILSGLRVLSRRFVDSYPCVVTGFELETDMTVHALDRQLRVAELPISYRERPDGGASKIRPLRDGVRIVRAVFALYRRYRPLAFFGGVSGVLSVLGLLAGAAPIYDWLAFRFVYRIPLAVLASSLVVLAVLALTVGLILDVLVDNARKQQAQQVKLIKLLRAVSAKQITDTTE
jgi:glycosyltransferase involved in cell wall biosynthesis